MYLVKPSPSKKRRAVSQAPLKKTAGSGPLVLSQTSSNSHHQPLQHQASTDTKEDSEGDNGENGRQGVRFQLECKEVHASFVD